MVMTTDELIDFVKENLVYFVAFLIALFAFIIFFIFAIMRACKKRRINRDDSYVMVDNKGMKSRVVTSSIAVYLWLP